MKGIKGSTLPLSENIARERILKLIKEKIIHLAVN